MKDFLVFSPETTSYRPAYQNAKCEKPPKQYYCSFTKRECEGFLKECRKLLKRHEETKDAAGGDETAGRWLKELIDDLEWCVTNVRWLTSSCSISVENDGGKHD